MQERHPQLTMGLLFMLSCQPKETTALATTGEKNMCDSTQDFIGKECATRHLKPNGWKLQGRNLLTQRRKQAILVCCPPCPNRFYTSSAPWFGWIGWIGPAFSIAGTLKTTARQGRLLNHPQPLSIKIGRAWVSLLKGLSQPHIVGGTTSQVSVLASGDRSEETR